MPDPDGPPPAAAPRRSAGALGVLTGVLAGILAFLLIVLAVLVLGGNPGEVAEPDVVATAVAPGTATATPTATPTPTPTPTPSPSPTPTPTPDEDEGPTDADAAAFASRFQPPGAREVESVTVDVTGDDEPEIVVASVASTVTRVDVARWNGEAYEVVFTDQGGRADDIERFSVRDVTGDGVREIVTVQRTGHDGLSLSIWGWDGEGFVRQRARGGCWHGSHTYGVVGAELRADGLAASCDEAPEPVPAWSWDVYVWDGDAWVYDRTEGP